MKNTEVILIGHVGHGQTTSSTIKAIKDMGVNVVVVEDSNEYDNSFDIGGVRYAPIEQQKSGLSKNMMGILAVASMFAPVAGYGLSNKVRILPRGTDIIEEFKLIQEKKSNLGKWERDQVVHIFNKNFKKVI